MKKCYQTRNKFEYLLAKTSRGEDDVIVHGEVQHDLTRHDDCEEAGVDSQRACLGHVPIYDPFYGFVLEVLADAKVLSD